MDADDQVSTARLSREQSRALGALLGVHAGDSLGASLEFKSHAAIAKQYPDGLREIIGGGPFNWPAGHATDDTDLTRAVLLAYRDLHADGGAGQSVAHRAADHMLSWFQGHWPDRTPGQLPVDVGGATHIGLLKYAETRDPAQAGAGVGSAGNGSLMRCIPTALFQTSPSLITADSILISRITHDDERCTVSCAAYNAIVRKLIDGASPAAAVDAGEEVALELEGSDGTIVAAIRRGRSLDLAQTASRGPPSDLKGKCAGYVVETLVLAIAAVLDPRSFEDVLVDVIRVGKDTDTNGAVAGGLLGARDGMEAIPQRWREKLQFADEFTSVARLLLAD